MENREKKFYEYIDYMRNQTECSLTKKVIDNSVGVWNKLSTNKNLSIPDVCYGDDDNILFIWDNNTIYLECEIFGDGRVEFFNRNRTNEKLDFIEITIDNEISEDINNLFKHFYKVELLD